MECHTFCVRFGEMLREDKNSYNTKNYKEIDCATVKMVATTLILVPGYGENNSEKWTMGETLSVNMETEFWLATYSIVGALYNVNFFSVYSRKDRPRGNLDPVR